MINKAISSGNVESYNILNKYKIDYYNYLIATKTELAYYSRGGISYSDVDNMTPYERNEVMNKLIEIIQQTYVQ